jgi:hypothetical protein
MGCGTVWSGTWTSTFRRNILPAYSEFRIEAAYSSETSVLTYQTARSHNAYAQAMNIILQRSHTYTKLQDVYNPEFDNVNFNPKRRNPLIR